MQSRLSEGGTLVSSEGPTFHLLGTRLHPLPKKPAPVDKGPPLSEALQTATPLAYTSDQGPTLLMAGRGGRRGVTFLKWGEGREGPFRLHSGPHRGSGRVPKTHARTNKRRGSRSGSSLPKRKSGGAASGAAWGLRGLTVGAGLCGNARCSGVSGPCVLLVPSIRARDPALYGPGSSSLRTKPSPPRGPSGGKSGRCFDHLCLTRRAPPCEPPSLGERPPH